VCVFIRYPSWASRATLRAHTRMQASAFDESAFFGDRRVRGASAADRPPRPDRAGHTRHDTRLRLLVTRAGYKCQDNPADQWLRLETAAQQRPLQVLVAGRLRAGTGDDPDKIAANVHAMEVVALDVLRRGHLPIVGEWISFPLMARAGSTRIGDAVYDELQHPIGERIVECSDVCLRIGGPSSGADRMVAARRRGRLVITAVDQLPLRHPGGVCSISWRREITHHRYAGMMRKAR
jgi:hypothetical protein